MASFMRGLKMFSLAPLLLILVSVAGLLQFGKHRGRADEQQLQADGRRRQALGGLARSGQQALHCAGAARSPIRSCSCA